MVMIETTQRCRLTSVTLLLVYAAICVASCTVETRFSSGSDVPDTYKEFQAALADADGGASPDDPVFVAFGGTETVLALYAAIARAGKYVSLDLSESSVTGFGDGDSSSPLGMSFIVSVVLPNNLSRIGRKAFEGCVNLRRAVIPDSVTEIGEYAFHSCLSLESVTIPENVDYIDRSAFSGCENLCAVHLMGYTRIADITVFPGGAKFREVAALSGTSEDGSYVAVRGTYMRSGTEWSGP